MANLKHKKGFTLIELLLVISIIGLLSTIVISSVNDARNNAILANIQENAITMRNEMEIYYSGNNNYGENFSGNCPTTSNSTNAFGQQNFIDALQSTLNVSPGSNALCEIIGNNWSVTIETSDGANGNNKLGVPNSFGGDDETTTYCFDSEGDTILQNGASYDEASYNGSCVETEI